MDNQTLAALGDYADGQYGQITAEQAQAVGADLTELAATGFAEPVTTGVWRLRAGGHHSHPRLYAAWLRLAPTVPAWQREIPASGVVSHASALRLYRAGDEAGASAEFSCPPPIPPAPTAPSTVHLVPHLTNHDWQTVDGLPVTTPARTLIDVADRLDTDELARVIDTLIATSHTTAAQLRREIPTLLDQLSTLGAEHQQLGRLVAELPDHG